MKRFPAVYKRGSPRDNKTVGLLFPSTSAPTTKPQLHCPLSSNAIFAAFHEGTAKSHARTKGNAGLPTDNSSICKTTPLLPVAVIFEGMALMYVGREPRPLRARAQWVLDPRGINVTDQVGSLCIETPYQHHKSFFNSEIYRRYIEKTIGIPISIFKEFSIQCT